MAQQKKFPNQCNQILYFKKKYHVNRLTFQDNLGVINIRKSFYHDFCSKNLQLPVIKCHWICSKTGYSIIQSIKNKNQALKYNLWQIVPIIQTLYTQEYITFNLYNRKPFALIEIIKKKTIQSKNVPQISQKSKERESKLG